MRVSTRLYKGRDDDLILWLNDIEPGQKATEIKRLLRKGLGVGSSGEPTLNLDTFRADLIGDFRQILEAAFESVSVAGQKVAKSDEDQEVEQMLDDFDFGL